jgi:hypothetical protein
VNEDDGIIGLLVVVSIVDCEVDFNVDGGVVVVDAIIEVDTIADDDDDVDDNDDGDVDSDVNVAIFVEKVDVVEIEFSCILGKLERFVVE